MKNNSLFRSATTPGRRIWTISFLFLFSTFLTDPLPAEPPPAAPSEIAPQRLAPEELKTLLAPIALYPDALIALILPASTFPSDLVLAARYISSNGDPAQVANQPWDESVKSLVRYPDVLNWMDQNLEWTTTLGGAFIDQPADVMNAIQGLRTEALAAGNLTDSPQQQIVQEESIIRIVPAEPDVIYVPQYDPEVVYVQPYSQNFGPLLTFGAGFAVGSWLNYDFDWRRRSIYVGQWRPGWKHGRDRERGEDNRNWDRGDRDRNWDRGDRGENDRPVNFVNINGDTARQWQPTADSQRQVRRQRSNRANARLSETSPRDASEQPGGPSTLGATGNADPRSIRVPKPSRPDLTSKRTERIRRDSQQFDGSTGSPPAPNVSIDTTPGPRDRNQKMPAPTVAPNVPNDQPARGQGSGQSTNARNLNKRGSPQDTTPDSSEPADATSDKRGRNQKVPAPTVAPNVPNDQSTKGQGRGQDANARNLNKRESPQDTTPEFSEPADATSDKRGRNQKVPAPTVAPNVPNNQSAQGERSGKGGRNLDKQDGLQEQAAGASERTSTMPEPRSKNERKTAPTVAPNVPNQQGAQGPSGGKSGSPRNSDKDAQGSRSNDGVENRPSGVPKQKQVDRSSSSQSNNSPQPANEQKREQKPPAPPPAKQSKPPQASAPERQDKPAAVNQNTAPRQSSAPREKGKGKGDGEKKADDKKNKNDN